MLSKTKMRHVGQLSLGKKSSMVDTRTKEGRKENHCFVGTKSVRRHLPDQPFLPFILNWKLPLSLALLNPIPLPKTPKTFLYLLNSFTARCSPSSYVSS